MSLTKHLKSPVYRTCFIASLAMIQSSAEASSATQHQIVESCETCHGAGGNSQVTSTPRLNGQPAEYMLNRLKSLFDGTRANPHVKVEMFNALLAASDTDKASIAAYFAGQPPTVPTPGTRAAEGRRIFEDGVSAENVIACNLCHGAQGEGHNAAPRLAGQHADYLKAQLILFNLNFRQHGKMNAETVTGSRLKLFGAGPAYHAPMNANTKAISRNTIDALVSYLGDN